MSRPKHKEVTRYVAGNIGYVGDRPDEVVVTSFTMVETAKQFRLKSEDSKEFRLAARFLTRAHFSKDNEHEMAHLHTSPTAALVAYYVLLKRKHDYAQSQVRHFVSLMTKIIAKICEEDDA